MLFSYIVSHVSVNFLGKLCRNEKVIKKTQKIRFFLHTLYLKLAHGTWLKYHELALMLTLLEDDTLINFGNTI